MKNSTTEYTEYTAIRLRRIAWSSTEFKTKIFKLSKGQPSSVKLQAIR
jgi:hypothetical protein